MHGDGTTRSNVAYFLSDFPSGNRSVQLTASIIPITGMHAVVVMKVTLDLDMTPPYPR